MKKAIWILTLFVLVLASCTPSLDDAEARDVGSTPDGKRVIFYFEKGTNNKIGERSFYPNSQQCYTELRYKDSKRHGECYTFHDNGNKWSLNTYENGVLDGEYRAWYENGKIRIEGEYENGKETGEWIFYNENGTEASRVSR
jgi:antitoxin component YwqK of YwqJK toxin-antitoxin module